MAHVLIDGNRRMLPRIRALLRGWGVTLGTLPEEARARGCATLAECDAVLFLCDELDDPSRRGATHLKPVDPAAVCLEHDEACAPLLVIGTGPLAAIMARHAERAIAEPGPDGSWLREALDDCLRRPLARALSAPEMDPDEQLHFLGHELRSPLTAIKTALEVMEGELWQDEAAGRTEEALSRQRMLQIALRNVRRMHSAVDWSQNLLKFETSRRRDERCAVHLAGLCEGLGQLAGQPVAMLGDDRRLECDADLLLHLGGQALHAMRCDEHLPPLGLSLELDTTAGTCLRLRLRHGGGFSAEGISREELRVHLQRFADFLNPCETVRRVGGEIAVVEHEGVLELAVAIGAVCCGEPVLRVVG